MGRWQRRREEARKRGSEETKKRRNGETKKERDTNDSEGARSQLAVGSWQKGTAKAREETRRKKKKNDTNGKYLHGALQDG